MHTVEPKCRIFLHFPWDAITAVLSNVSCYPCLGSKNRQKLNTHFTRIFSRIPSSLKKINIFTWRLCRLDRYLFPVVAIGSPLNWKVNKMSLTSKQYADIAGMLCPVCESNSIVAGDHELSENQFFVNVICDSCNSVWTDCYELKGYDNLENRQI